MSSNFTALKAAIYQMGLLFNQQPGPDKINAYAKALENFSTEQVKFAFNQVIQSGGAFFPSLSEILIHLKPKVVSTIDSGNEVASEIIQACVDKGRYRTDMILDSLSSKSKALLESNRYLIMEILNSDEDSLRTIRAQIRDLAKARNEGSNNFQHNQKLQSIGIDTSKVLPMKEAKKVAFSEFEPEGA